MLGPERIIHAPQTILILQSNSAVVAMRSMARGQMISWGFGRNAG